MALCFIFLLMLLQTHLSLHSTLSMQKHEDVELGKFSTLKLNYKSFMEDESRSSGILSILKNPQAICSSNP
ncbi:hypothetical protein L2E82_22885 [Cichorium intybus]|uniref:Uncharacterized protein n=1 Tax=Cichorium intybus TaxID=13427 RepID=A0ACB9DYH2_CICIN|nr:hypothetical protein L2E82_22885 [Cichorium intybus]